MHNLYVAGHLMQDPSRDAGEILREYAEGFVGKEAAPVLVRALEVVEHARNRSLRYSYKVGDPNEALRDEKQDVNELPADWNEKGLIMTAAALEELEGLTLPTSHEAAWPVTLLPQEFLGELTAHLKSIHEMQVFIKAEEAVLQSKAAGAPQDELTVAIAALPMVVYDPAHTAGLEAAIYEQKLSALKKEVGVE